jgi:hypothetical protein
MKLPESKKERLQVFILIGVGVVAVLYAMMQLLVTPFTASKQKLRESLQTTRDYLDKAERELKFAPSLKEEFNSVSEELDQTIATNVLHSILGSYLVGVADTIETQARALNIKVDEVQEVGIRELPRPNKKGATSAPVYFKSYSVQVAARATYEQATSFIRNLETINPYLCVSEIRITGQADDPEHHRLNLKIEWPIEAEAEKGKSATGERGGGL